MSHSFAEIFVNRNMVPSPIKVQRGCFMLSYSNIENYLYSDTPSRNHIR